RLHVRWRCCCLIPWGHRMAGRVRMEESSSSVQEFYLERYRYILRQIEALNESVYRFLALYQTIATSLAGALLLLFIGYRSWGLSSGDARAGVIGIMFLLSLVAAFTILL